MIARVSVHASVVLSKPRANAVNMQMRANLLVILSARIRSWNLVQEVAAERLRIGRPRLNDLLRGKLDKFSLDALVNLTALAGLTLEIKVQDEQCIPSSSRVAS